MPVWRRGSVLSLAAFLSEQLLDAFYKENYHFRNMPCSCNQFLSSRTRVEYVVAGLCLSHYQDLWLRHQAWPCRAEQGTWTSSPQHSIIWQRKVGPGLEMSLSLHLRLGGTSYFTLSYFSSAARSMCELVSAYSEQQNKARASHCYFSSQSLIFIMKFRIFFRNCDLSKY
jgi:hypothetical protein